MVPHLLPAYGGEEDGIIANQIIPGQAIETVYYIVRN